jgi:proprotein convertase subtilisin/kexin type 5
MRNSTNITTSTLQCLSQCPSGYRPNFANSSCEKCVGDCLSCSRNVNQCEQCSGALLSYNNTCVKTCPNATFALTNEKRCVDCPTGCQNCTAQDTCTTCKANFTMVVSTNPKISNATLHTETKVACVVTNATLNATISSCPVGTFYNVTAKVCQICKPGCGACNATTCLSNCSF